MKRRTFVASVCGAATLGLVELAAQPAVAATSIAPTLIARDPKASVNAQAVYAELVQLENGARSGRAAKTIIGQHIEGQNELYNAAYGDTGGTTYVGYYYNKIVAITGKLPGFVEIDLGPGYNSTNGWGVFNPRRYDQGDSLPQAQKQWQYVDDAVDLAFGVWKGYPRAADSTYDYNGQVNCDGTVSVTAPLANGGGAAGIVGMSFHQPYPTSSTKDYKFTLAANAPQQASGDWFARVVDWQASTPEYQALLTDLSYLADQLNYFAEYDIPVLLRPYHEMNQGSFWWGGQDPTAYKALWQIMYNYLVNTRGLHNLLFVWAPISWNPTGADVPWNYYPGAAYVDIVAVDYYNKTGAAGLSTGDATSLQTYYAALVHYSKPRMLAESYYVPVSTGVNALIGSPWVIWTVWGDGLTSHNTNADVKSTYYNTSKVYTGGAGTGFGQNFDWGSLHRV